MEGVLSVIKKTCTGFQCLPCEQVSLDYGHVEDYQDANQRAAESVFERPRPATTTLKVTELDSSVPTLLRYFLDGSRRTYKVGDVILDGRRFLPVVAGQIGVAVVQRSESLSEDSRVHPIRDLCSFRNVIAFPNVIGEQDRKALEAEFKQRLSIPFYVVAYQVHGKDPTQDPVDLAIAKILTEMHSLEIQTVQRMVANHLLDDQYSMLVVDGPLQFRHDFDVLEFRNVIGLSKTFRPTFPLGHGRSKIDVGSLTAGMEFAERTAVFKNEDHGKTIGMWYLRLRPRQQMTNPLQGIVKVERYAVDEAEREDGFRSDRVNTISAYLLRERNVTVPFRDSRWASHLYPVYQAESYLKSSFLSDAQFRAHLR